MRSVLTVILGLMFFSLPGWAQEDNFTTATSALQDVLSSLKQSVNKLATDNDQWMARDQTVKAQVMQLQAQFVQLQAQGDLLNKAAQKLQDKNPRRSREITRLEDENYNLDDRIQKAQAGMKSTQESLDAGYPEVQRLLLQLKDLQNQQPVPLQAQAPNPQSPEHRQIERLKLMKMIYESQQRQEDLHQSIVDFQKNTPFLPAASAMAHQEQLKEQIKDIEGQLASIAPQKISGDWGTSNQWNDAQLHQLEEELKVLEKNYLQLKDLMEQMSRRSQSVQVTVNQRVEAQKLQSSLKDLNHQGRGLLAQLDDLRSQMVDLDKRKTRLEAMIQQ